MTKKIYVDEIFFYVIQYLQKAIATTGSGNVPDS